MKKMILLLIAVTFVLNGCRKNDDQEVYLFSYFRGNGEDGLYLAASDDGYTFTAINNDKPLLQPTAGNDKLMRDPCIIQGPDGTFHMVWTVSWNERGIGYSSSKDLITWQKQKFIPVMKYEPTARNCWAPEVFYDDATQQFIIFWSTTIPGYSPETEKTADAGWDHRMYYTVTKDFNTFSKTKIFYDHGFNVIDGTLLKNNNIYYLFLKDETRYPPQKNIRVATAQNVEGPYSTPSIPITGNYWAEGPTALKIGDKYIVYFDKYAENKMGAICSSDLKNWDDISDKISFPQGIRHGTIFKVKRKIFDKLLKSLE